VLAETSESEKRARIASEGARDWEGNPLSVSKPKASWLSHGGIDAKRGKNCDISIKKRKGAASRLSEKGVYSGCSKKMEETVPCRGRKGREKFEKPSQR